MEHKNGDYINYKKIFKNRERRLKLISMLRFIPDKQYLKMLFRIKTGKKLNLKNPKTFREKLNWLKVNDIHPEYTELVDKVRVKEIVAKKIGKEHIVPTLGVWEHFDDIDFDLLPEKFILKCTHDSGSIKIVEKSKGYDKDSLKTFFEGRLSMNQYYLSREYPYNDVPRRIIAEKFLESKDGTGIKDYKFLCFNGEPKMMFIAFNVTKEKEYREEYFDMDYNYLNITAGHSLAENPTPKPKEFEKMKEIAKTLSKGIKHVRIDLYVVDGTIYFGEYTFFSGGGVVLFEPYEWEETVGEWLEL